MLQKKLYYRYLYRSISHLFIGCYSLSQTHGGTFK